MNHEREPLWTTRFILLCLTNFLLFMSFFFLLPTLPVYLVNELQAKESQVGLIIGIFTIAAVLARPLTGYYLDHSDQKKIYILAVLLFVLATSSYLFAFSVMLFLIVRFLHGFGFGMATTAGGTMAAEWIPASRRGEGIGYYGTFVMVAMAMGPLIGVFLAEEIGYTSMFLLCLGFSVVGAFLASFLRPPVKEHETVQQEGAFRDDKQRIDNEQQSSGEASQESAQMQKALHLLSSLFELKAVPVALCMMMIAVVFGGCVTFIALYATELGDPKMAGVYFSLYALSLVLTRPFAGRWYDHKGPFMIVTFGTFVYFAGIVLLGLAQGPLLLYLAAIVIGIGYGSLQPSYQALVIQVSPEGRKGAATATFFTSFDIGVGTGAFFLGFIAHTIGYGNMFLISSIFLVFSYLLFRRFWFQYQRTNVPAQEDQTSIQA